MLNSRLCGPILKEEESQMRWRPISQLTRRQRFGLMALGVLNISALCALALLFGRAPSSENAPLYTLLVEPAVLRDCRQSASRALLQAGQSGLVNAQEDGSILIQLQRVLVTNTPRFDADAAIWTALEAVASSSDCVGFTTVFVTVGFVDTAGDSKNTGRLTFTDRAFPTAPASKGADDRGATRGQALQAEARANMVDLLTWTRGQIDDAQLALRIDYKPPATLSPIPIQATAVP